MDLPAARHLAETLLAEHGLSTADPPWTFRFNRRKRALGTCHYGPRRIELSSHFVVANDPDEVRDTVLHEIAHALAGPMAGHGTATGKPRASRSGPGPSAWPRPRSPCPPGAGGRSARAATPRTRGTAAR